MLNRVGKTASQGGDGGNMPLLRPKAPRQRLSRENGAEPGGSTGAGICGGIAAKVNPSSPHFGAFSFQLDKYGGWERVALVPPAIPREEGCRDTACAPTPRFPSLLSRPKPPRNSPHGPVLTAATVQGGKKEKTPKREQARKASLRPVCTGPGRSPPRPPARSGPQARHGRRSQREMKSQRLSFW